MKQELETIWDALHAYREDLISTSDDEMNDKIWDDICTAMARIEESLR